MLAACWSSQAALPSLVALRATAVAQAAEYVAVYSLLCSHGRELGLAECRLTDIAFGVQSLLRLQPMIDSVVGDEPAAADETSLAILPEISAAGRQRSLRSWLQRLRRQRDVFDPEPDVGSLARALLCLELSHAAYGPFSALLVGASRGGCSAAVRALARRAAWRRPNAAAFEVLGLVILTYINQSIYLSIYPSIYLNSFFSIYLFISISISISICIYIYIPLARLLASQLGWTERVRA